MGHWIGIIASALLGYGVGSISFAVLIARSRGIDIFKVGSGNPGATNVLRSLGKGAGYTCFVLDALKGVVAVLLGHGMAIVLRVPEQGAWFATVGLLAAILGHSFSAFLRFRGGKGVATTVGGLLALMPVVMLVGAGCWLAVFFTTRYVSLASIVLGVSLPVSAWISGGSRLQVLLCGFLAILILVRHRANIRRLMAGTENRAGKRK